MRDIADMLSQNRLFQGMKAEHIETIAGCGTNVRFQQGETLMREGDPAESFYLITHGRVGLEIYVPHRGPVMLETILENDVVGWSWLFPPYEGHYDARAVVLTRAVKFDAACIRGKLDADPAFGYEMMKRFAGVMVKRLNAARLQMLDVYGSRT